MLRRAVPVALAALAACKSPQPCPSPLEECAGQCVDLQSDRRHCTGCGNACAAGQVCTGGACRADVLVPCPVRLVNAGGAVVTLSHCGATVKLWVVAPDFISEAVTYVGSTAPARLPLVGVTPGVDCDGQWSWHADHLTPSFVSTIAPSGCDLCPDAVEAGVRASSGGVLTWCPTAARVVAVDLP